MMEHRQEEEGVEEGLHRAMPEEEEEDLRWEPLGVEAAVIQHRASEEVEAEEHQQDFRLVEAEGRLPHRLPEQAWKETSLYQQQRVASAAPWCQTG